MSKIKSILSEHRESECIYCAPESFFNKHYESILLCEKNALDDIDEFLKTELSYFNGFIIIDNETEDFYECRESYREKFLMYLRTPFQEKNRSLLLRAASILDLDWIFFIHSNERLDHRFCDFSSFINDEHIRAVSCNIVIVDNGKRYYILPETNEGILNEVRLLKLNKCSTDEIQDKNSELYQTAFKSDILIHSFNFCHYTTEKEINLFTRSYNIQGLFFKDQGFMNYEEIGDGTLPNLVREEVVRLGKYYLKKEDRFDHIGLYSGDAGVILVLAQYYLYTGDERYLDKMYVCLDDLQHLIGSGNKIMTSFCDGLAGFGWLICYLQQKGLINIDEEYFEEMDKTLNYNIETLHMNHYIDQMHGLISIGRYFLKRKQPIGIEYILNVLAETAEYDNNEIKWMTTSMPTKPPKYDFGLAHGMAGILYFLGKCHSQGIKVDLCQKLGDGIMAFYQHNEQDYDLTGTFFPFSIEQTEYARNTYNHSCRLAWCYGDIGVLYSIYLYALSTDNKSLQISILPKLILITQNKDCKNAWVHDGQFCHGAAGLVHMYNHLYILTHIPAFKRASQYWLKVLLTMGHDATTKTGYTFLLNNKERIWGNSDNLLEGLSGVALVLLSVLDYANIDWDESMMLI